MSNNFFRFKRFKINHDRCAMKVGTDGVLLGAWGCVDGHRILDIGTGSGLIALMAAQRNPDAEVLCIDIDEGAVLQAQENIVES
ncbi:MAG: methyltransferase, partial [Bacteroidaceae bacterium]|nr:methyltransferase [Bacteroidaceae bacterium]